MPGIAVWASDLTGTVLLNLDLSKKCGSTTRPVLVLALNGTIHIYDDHLEPFGKDPNRENNQASQAPITPFTSTKPTNYIAHNSSVLLGNATSGKKSNKYYKYKEYSLQTSSLY